MNQTESQHKAVNDQRGSFKSDLSKPSMFNKLSIFLKILAVVD